MPRKGENIYKRKDNRWEGWYKNGFNENGKTKYRSVYGKSYQEVKNKLIMLKSKPVSANISGNITVGELFEKWFSAIKFKIKNSTHANYRMKVDKHILPYFGGIRYDQLSVDLVHEFIESKLKSGLSAKYVSDIVIVFKSMSKYVYRVYGYKNPFENVILPKVKKQEIKLLSDNQQEKLCSHLMQNMNNTSLCILLSLYTGLRIGEICGLKWGDIDFGKSILSVKRTVQRIHTEKGRTSLIIDTPKSKTSQRLIPIPAFLMKLLREFRSVDNMYVLSGDSNVIEPRTMQRRFKTILKKACLPSVNFHCLRHSFATNCVKVGFDIKTLSEILGHSNVETTLNRYVHSSIERKAECMNLLKIVA